MTTKPQFGVLGKPPTPKPDPWTKDEFIRRITLIEARLTLLENNHAEDHVTTSQHRRALADACNALVEALSEPPYKFTPEQQRAWDEANKRIGGGK